MKLRLLSLIVIIAFNVFILNAQWSQLGPKNNPILNGYINSITSDTVANIYAAGYFVNDSNKIFIAKWDGKNWSELGGKNTSPINGEIYTIIFDNIGNLYASGGFTDSAEAFFGKEYVAKWDGKNWSRLGGNDSNGLFNNVINCLATDNKGNFYVGGFFKNQKGNNYVAKWDGNSWSELGGTNTSTFNGAILNIITDKAGNVYANGGFLDSNQLTYLAKWDGSNWNKIGGNNTPVFNYKMLGLAMDSNEDVYTFGQYYSSNDYFLAKWDKSKWSLVDSPYFFNEAILSMTIDKYNNIYVGGGFTSGLYTGGSPYIAKWDGTKWSQLGDHPFNSTIQSIHIDKNGNFYAGGAFSYDSVFAPLSGHQYVAKYIPLIPTLIIDKIDTPTCANYVYVPVRGNNLTNISKLKGSIHWDTANLKLVDLKFTTNNINMNYKSIDTTNIANGNLNFNWSDTLIHSITNFDSLFTLQFYPKTNVSGLLNIWFDTIPNKLEIDTAYGVVVANALFNNGWINWRDTPQIIQTGNIIICNVGCAPAHYQWFNNGISIVGDTLNYIVADSSGNYSVQVTYRRKTYVSSIIKLNIPVSMQNFTASYSATNTITFHGKVLLNWNTTKEINISKFIIERSTDSISYTKIDTVNAGGAGTYNYTDQIQANINQSKLFYHLVITDNNNNKYYSETRTVLINSNNSGITLMPNPAKSIVTITGSNIKQVILLDLTGRVVITKEVGNSNQTNLLVNNLPKRIYLVKIIHTDGSINTEKLLVE